MSKIVGYDDASTRIVEVKVENHALKVVGSNDSEMNTSLNNIETTLNTHSGYIDNIESNQTDGSQVCKIMGSEDATTTGTQHQIHLDGSGNVHTSVVNTINVAPANSVNSKITDDPANSVAVGIKGRETISDSSTEKFIQCDSGGKLIISNTQNLGVKLEDLSSTLNADLAGHTRTLAVGLRARTDIASHSSGEFLKCEATGELNCKSKQHNTFSAETVYVSGQTVSGSGGSYTGASIVVDANAQLFMVEHNFSNTNMTYNVQSSIDGTTWFSLNGTAFNSSTPVLSNLEILSSSMNFGTGFPPYIRFVITNNDASAQTATLSYVVKSN